MPATRSGPPGLSLTANSHATFHAISPLPWDNCRKLSPWGCVRKIAFVLMSKFFFYSATYRYLDNNWHYERVHQEWQNGGEGSLTVAFNAVLDAHLFTDIRHLSREGWWKGNRNHTPLPLKSCPLLEKNSVIHTILLSRTWGAPLIQSLYPNFNTHFIFRRLRFLFV